MKRLYKLKLALPLFLVSLFLFAFGCKTYKVDVKLNPDGSGERTVELSMKEIPEGDLQIEASELRKLFHLDGSEWEYIEYKKETESGQDGEKVYRRTQKAKNLEAWHEMGGDIHIRAAVDDKRYAKVAISNSIDVELGTSQTARSLTYRETITCTELRQTIFTFMSNGFYNKVAAAYPMLGSEELVELRGLMMGYFAVAWYREKESGDVISDEHITEDLTADAGGIIRRAHPDVDLTQLRAIIEKTLDDLEDELDRFVMENLPGMYLAGHAAFILRLEMPGRIVEHNASDMEEQTLTWKIDLMEVFVNPIEIFAKAEITE